ncbi:spore coat protein [Spirochaetia bacterium]|nr:spore coat protein [Spirochaetia bacterium]
MNEALIIAELGTSHGADAGKARELIDAAAGAGADCVKFQMVYADEILHPNTGEVALPGGRIRLYDRFRELERDLGFYADLKGYTETKGLLFLCTPFGPRSARELLSLEPALMKIASPELNHVKLLAELAHYPKRLFLSTGVSKISDIEAALDILSGGPDVCLLHCVTAYPAPETDYNLRVMQNLSAIFGVPAGVSDHSLDPELVPVLAAALGAAAIEKHFCLSRDDPGLDDPIALPPADFKRMVKSVRHIAGMDKETALEEIKRDRGASLVEKILGDGVKRLSPAEKANYGRTNRSLHALGDIQPGEIIRADMLAALRTEKILRPGLPPCREDEITGRRARLFIPAGEGIRAEDLD